MNVAHARVLAVVLALLQVAPLLPVADASHLAPPLPDGLPTLPHAEPTSQCIGLAVPIQVLARLQDPNGFGFREKEGVPSLCSLDGQPMQPWADAIRALDQLLDNYRNVTNELERQYEQRLEYAVPQGPCVEGDAVGGAAPYACPLMRPQVTLLADRFDGRRLGGFGDWTVVTDGDAEPAWRPAVTVTNNGTQNTWRFGTETGYPRGAHQWLVSPEIDLGAVRGDVDLAQALVVAHAAARDSLRGACDNRNASQEPAHTFANLCSGDGSSNGGATISLGDGVSLRDATHGILDAYEAALDAHTRGLAVGQHAATLSLTLRLNLASGEDGVRVWAWAGEEPPTRIQLYDLQRFGREPTRLECLGGVTSRYVPGTTEEATDAACHEVALEDGAAFLLAERGLPSVRVKALQSAALGEKPYGLSGDARDFVTLDVPLSEFVGQRVWLLFEAATTPDAGRGEDYFGDRARFPRQESFGFELASVRAVGDAWPRNVRLNDLSSAFTRMPAGNPFGDAKRVRTTLPPGEDVVARIHNAGGYVENATLDVTFRANDYDGAVAVGGFEKLADDSVRVVNMRPGETREVRIPWPEALEEDSLYVVSANLTVDDLRQLPPLSNATEYAQPETTGVRPQNRAETDGNATGLVLVRAYTDHRLSARHYPPGKNGPALEVCGSVSALLGCDPLYVAAKGERRILLLGVRNDGSVPEDASAVLDLRLDGVDKTSVIQGGPVRELRDLLPGETRAVQWELAPADAGAYNATVYLRLANGTILGEPVSRLVFVQRSTGLICFDDLAADRECGASFASTRPDGLRNETPSASALGPDGSLYVATETTATTGALWRQAPDGAWTMLENLSGDALDARVARIRSDLGFGTIRDLFVDGDGTLYLAGDNATLLVRPPPGVGSLHAVGYPIPPPPPLHAHPGAASYTVEAGQNATLTGSIHGGAAPYEYLWVIESAPTGGDARLWEPLDLLTNFSATTPGDYVVALNATDAAGAATQNRTTLHVTSPTPACARNGDAVVMGAILATDDADPALGAVDLRCVTVTHTATDVKVGVFVGNVSSFPSGASVKYTLSFTVQGVPFSGTFTWGPGSTGNPAFTPANPPFAGTVVRGPAGFLVTFQKQKALLVSDTFTMQQVKVDAACASPCTLSDGIGPRDYSLSTDFTPPAKVAGLAVQADPRRADAVDLAWSPVADATRYVVERAAWPDGWAVVGGVDAPAFKDTDAETGRAYDYRVRAVDAAENAGEPSVVAHGTPRAPSPHHLAVAKWNGTVFVGGLLGETWWLNETSGSLEPITLTLQRGASAGTRVQNEVRDMAVSPDGKRLHLAVGGNVFVNEGRGALWRTDGWLEAFTPYPHTYDLLALAAHGDHVYAAGRSPAGGVLLVTNGTQTYARAPAPEVAGGVPGLAALASAPDGRLFAVTTDANAPIAACACPGADWTFPAVPLPSIPVGDTVRRANLVSIAAAAGRAVAVAEGGVVLEYARRGAYPNDEDWSVQPALRVRDGSAYQLAGSNNKDQILRFEPITTNATDTSGWTQLRVTVDHHVAKHGTPDLRIRTFYLPFPNAAPTRGLTGDNTCTANCVEDTLGLVADERLIEEATDSGGWERLQYFVGLPRETTTGVETVASFTAIEFFVEADAGANWAVDDVTVEGYFPSSSAWREILSWNGTAKRNANVVVENQFAAGGGAWAEVTEPFDIDTVSAWHLSQDLADRPVWVFNNELYPADAGGGSPRLLSDWDSRLVSPIIDLGEAYDPVVTFRHAYAFKTRIFKGTPSTDVEPGDGGWVEIQYEKRGEECGAGMPADARCWSAFHTICPDASTGEADVVFPAYPDLCKAGTGYPRMKDLGLTGAHTTYNGARNTDPYDHPIGPKEDTGDKADENPAASFWGRSVIPDPSGVITGVRDTTQYEEVQVTLSKQSILDETGQPVDFAGRRVRVGFHGLTAPSEPSGAKWDYKDELQLGASRTTFPGEGWYLTDFKVRGATQLGVDLRATNLTFQVGYEWGTLGVGPGTRVPINVTIENRGVFEAAGYTGVLQARRVVDAALGVTEVVGEVALSQQAVLPAGKARNHTLLWPVPETEGARYTLTFTVSPIGIARDEDFTDNLARIGSAASPVPAQTRPSYEAGVLISPADATKDITRYLAIVVDNTGNVVLGDQVDGQQTYFRVTRRIYQMGTQEAVLTTDCDAWRRQVALTGRTGPLVDCRTWNTTVPVVFGTTASLASISNEFNPATDLLWKPPTSADYRIVVTAELLSRSPSAAPSAEDAPVKPVGKAAERIVRSFDTYLFDDAELGPRGFAIKGEWAMEPGWGDQEPGFRSSRSYGFGDPVLLRYTADVDTSMITPIVDLGTARSARFAMYHRYDFEPGYDGGVVEASVDGGKTWRRLTPLDADLNGKYDKDHPIAATSPIHLTGDPANTTLAFTGHSSDLPQATDGWVLSIFDLTEYSDIAEDDVPYELFDSAAMANYRHNGSKDAGPIYTWPTHSNTTYFDSTWNVGRVDAFRYWEVQNLAEDDVRPHGGAGDDFWWSGSNTLQDDKLRPVENTWLTIDVRSVTPKVQDGDRVVVQWWEWLDRTRLGLDKYLAEKTKVELRPDPRETRGAFVWNDPSALPQNYHVNLTPPSILARDGNWMLLQSDITDWIQQDGDLEPITSVSFVYTPVKKAPTYDPYDGNHDAQNATLANDTTRYTDRWLDDRGFVIDEFTIKASKVVGGQEFDARVLMDEDQAWANAVLQRCALDAQGNAEPDHDANWVKLPCTGTPEHTKAAGAPNLERDTVAKPVYGRTWVNTTWVPPVAAEWEVVEVMDKNGYSPTKLPPTGERPVAWYTGPVCDDDKLDYTVCLLPGEQSRLVTPAFDLSTIAGSAADLTFTHRYGFYTEAVGPYPFASGGAVEVQVYDEQTGQWGAWKQLYPDPDAIYYEKGDDNWTTAGDVARLVPAKRTTALGPDSGFGSVRGGYSAYTANETRDQTGRIVRRDAPFEPIRTYDPETRGFTDVQFLYSGTSTSVTGDPANGWLDARFPLTDYLGKTVRIGFHVSVDGMTRTTQGAPGYSLHNPDGPLGELTSYDKGGWWIGNVAIVGKVLHGAPVQLRARVATDGNVQDGRWQIDDVGIFGSHYGENVGIFVDPAKAYGGMEGHNVTIPVVIRNLGEAVRENLAIDVRELSVGGKRLTLNGAPGSLHAEHLADDPNVLRMSGYTLAPGQSATAYVNVTVREGLAIDRDDGIQLLVELKQFNPLEGGFRKIPFNEVQGFLTRRVPFTAERFPLVTVDHARSLTVSPQPGAPVDVAVEVTNRGFENVALNLTCAATVRDGYAPQDHRDSDDEQPHVAATVPCERLDNATTLAPGANATVAYRVRPDAPGALHVEVGGTVKVGDVTRDVKKPGTLTVLLGRPPLLYKEGFDEARTVTANWTAGSASKPDSSTPPAWSQTRGHDRPGALLLGIRETDHQNGASYAAACSAVCKAVTRPFDLHNFTTEDVQLSFWHMDRLAKYDGAQVSWQVLLDEKRPGLASSWSEKHCVLVPRGGYDTASPARSHVKDGDSEPADDTIPYPDWKGDHSSPGGDPPLFFTSAALDDAWSYAAFDLREQQPCKADPNHPDRNVTLMGHTVRFVFAVYAGGVEQGGLFQRGKGQGWLVDDVAVSTSRLTLRPATEQRALLLDNTTKGFHLVAGNLAAEPTLVRFEVDEGNSSAPAGSIHVPKDPVLIPARTEGQLVRVDVQLPRDPSLLPTQFRARILARSVLDATTYATSDLTLDFQPRQWAELAVSVTPPTLAVQEGTETFLPITVENTGVVESAASTVRVTDAWEGGTQTYDIDLPSMPSYFQSAEDALRVLEFRWRPQKGSIGVHTLTFDADPQQLGEEYTRVNNVVTLRVPVAELLLPDVDVAGADALRLRNAVGQTLVPLKEGGVTRYESAAGELVTLEVKVRNPGRAAATNVDVRAFIGPLSLPAKTVPYVGPGEEVGLTFNWVAQKGDYPIEVVARSEQVEASAANNRNPAQGVTVLTVKGFEVKVDLPDVEGVLEPGTEVKLPFNVTNVGNAGEDVRLVARVPEGWNASVARSELFLRSGETFSTTLTLQVPAHAVAGANFISVDAIARSNPMKAATASARSTVRAFYGGSVEATTARAAPPLVTLPLTLVNEGNSLEPWTVTLTLPPGWTTTEAQPLHPVVPAHGQTTIPLHVRMAESTPPGERQVGVRATLPDGTRRDGVLRVDVRELRAATAVVADERPREAQGALSYAVLVQNAGNVPQPFEVVLVKTPDGLDATLTPSRFELQPGAKAVATLLVKPKPGVTAGAYQIDAFAAFAGVPPDTPEGRHNAQRLQLVVARPDLRAGQLDYAKAGVETGERVVVKVPIVNDGQGTATDLPVHLFVDDVFMGETRLAKLAPGEKRDVTLNWTAQPGQHTVTAVVDPWKDTVDADTRDNAVSALVQVDASPVRGLLGSARVPLPGMLVTFAAIALVALGTRRVLLHREDARSREEDDFADLRGQEPSSRSGAAGMTPKPGARRPPR